MTTKITIQDFISVESSVSELRPSTAQAWLVWWPGRRHIHQPAGVKEDMEQQQHTDPVHSNSILVPFRFVRWLDLSRENESLIHDCWRRR